MKKGLRSLKPSIGQIDDYHLQKKQGPLHIPQEAGALIRDDRYKRTLKAAAVIEAAYGMTKVVADMLSTIPGWTAFHLELHKNETLEKSAIHYLPVIESSPTEMSSVNEILNKSREMSDRLDLPQMILVFDQAIYSKVQQIRWKDEALTNRFIVRLGEFHTAMAFLAIIGKRFADAGMKDILIESEVVAEGSINGVVSSHHYNRSMRSHKLLAEGLWRLRFEVFLESLSEDEKQRALAIVGDLADVYPSEEFLSLSSGDAFTTLLSVYDSFVQRKISPRLHFRRRTSRWSSYCYYSSGELVSPTGIFMCLLYGTCSLGFSRTIDLIMLDTCPLIGWRWSLSP